MKSPLTQVGLEPRGEVTAVVAEPKVLDQLGVTRHEPTPRTQEVIRIDLGSIIIPQEVIGERYRVRQALQTGVDETRVAQIRESHLAGKNGRDRRIPLDALDEIVDVIVSRCLLGT